MRFMAIHNKKSLIKLQGRLRARQVQSQRAEALVRMILRKVQKNGDRALVEFTKRFDKYRLSPRQMRVSTSRIQQAYRMVPRADVAHLRHAAERIRHFHECQKTKTWRVKTPGITLGQLVRPLDIVGIYVPGGKAVYPSSVLMNAVPATVAGVARIVMCSPTPYGQLNPYLLVAADIAGVMEIYTVGGAQAIGAMAYGTQVIPKTDKIVGPGNLYVALAKKQVSGLVGIDMMAGPSEIVIIADQSANPVFIAADLLSQAEHDEQAMSVLITTSSKLIREVKSLLASQMSKLPRRAIIAASLRRYGMILQVKNMADAIEASNMIAPEHLELAVEQPQRLLPRIRHAGAVFLGHYTTESLGDYVAGPNHVLPTGGTARFASALSVDDFVKKLSLISFTKKGLSQVRDTVVRIAQMEGLQAHAKAVEVRIP